VVQYIFRRLLILPIIVLLVTAILFLMILQLPIEQRAMVYVPSANPHLTEVQFQALIERTIERYGLHKPFVVQYVNWVKNLFQGNLGYSPSSRQPVTEALMQRLPATIELVVFALVPAVVVALIGGSLAARFKSHVSDVIIRGAAFVGWALPPFIFGLMAMNILYAWMGWFPPERLSIWATPIVQAETFKMYTGMYTIDALLNGNLEIFVDAIRHLVLPGLTLSIVAWALLTRVMRDSLLEELHRDYITTARAKGLRERKIISVHARHNAILPVISTTGTAMSVFLGTIVVAETLFNFNGIGHWAAMAILFSDVPAAVGFTLFSAVAVVLSSLAADVLYAIVDPRVRLD